MVFPGRPLGKKFTVISKDKVLNKNTGAVIPAEEILKYLPAGTLPQSQTEQSSQSAQAPPVVIENAEIKKEVEVVVGIDGQRINFTLANSDGEISTNDGYLIEIYVSGSDGTLTRAYKEDVVDAANDNTLSEGFSNYLKLEID